MLVRSIALTFVAIGLPAQSGEDTLPLTDEAPRARPIAPRSDTAPFPIEAERPADRKWFAHGIAYLYANDWHAAERCFREVATSAPQTALAYWGMAMANRHRPARARAFITIAMRKRQAASPRNREILRLLASFFEVTPATIAKADAIVLRSATDPEDSGPMFRRSEAERAQMLERRYGALLDTRPQDLDLLALLCEHRLTYARHCLSAEDAAEQDRQLASRLHSKTGPIASVAAHPAWHLLARTWIRTPKDHPRRVRASEIACGLNPSLASAWQTEGRTATRLGHHDLAAWAYENAVRADHARIQQYQLTAHRLPRYAANREALGRSLLQAGRPREALEHAREMVELPWHPQHNRPRDRKSLVGRGQALLIETCRRFRMRKELEVHLAQGYLATGKHPRDAVHVTAGIAAAWFEFNERDKATPLLERMTALRADAWDAATARQIDSAIAELRSLARGERRKPRPAPQPRTAKTPPPKPRGDLGPRRYPRPAIPDFTLAQSNGKPVRFANRRGKPVVVIHYLGFGCLHCVDQLRAFHPHVGAFRKAGLQILTIGTDSVANMEKASADLPIADQFAYTMLSDAPAATFRSWRAFDFFAKETMHGTYLIDADGKVLFQDISHEPFNHPEWFLAECQRLLKKR